jgi:hypothetical protein
MKKFDWAVTAFDFSDSHHGRYRVQVEEAEDGISGAIMLLKEASAGINGPNSSILDEVLTDLSATVDKIRKLRTDLKNL